MYKAKEAGNKNRPMTEHFFWESTPPYVRINCAKRDEIRL